MQLIKELDLITSLSSTLTLLIAPPAWGKTRLLEKIIYEHNRKIIFISPLKALAMELYIRQSKKNKFFVDIITSKKDSFHKVKNFINSKNGLLICTPEIFDLNHLDYIKELSRDVLFVFDEFHLFYTWGLSFRFSLFEILMAVTNHGLPILGLTATLNDSLKKKVTADFSINYQLIVIFDYGNMKLLYPPKLSLGYKYLPKSLFDRRCEFELKKINGKRSALYFCKYRSQVKQLETKFQKIGLSVLTCVGGEVDQFIYELDMKNPPKVIIATSCLSHGVNLPPLSKVFINHPVSHDFFIQMIGRGGRHGEEYNAFHKNTSFHFRTLLFDFYLKIHSFVFSL